MLASIGDDDKKEWIYRIGNLALLSAPMNKNYKNKGFDVKRENCYKKEETIRYTRALGKQETSIKADIEQRQEELASLAVKAWRIDIE